MKSFLCVAVALMMSSIWLLCCHNISATPSVDQKNTEMMPSTNCQALAQVVEQPRHLVVTNKEDPDALWIEFSWSKTGERNQHTLDCYYKRINNEEVQRGR